MAFQLANELLQMTRWRAWLDRLDRIFSIKITGIAPLILVHLSVMLGNVFKFPGVKYSQAK